MGFAFLFVFKENDLSIVSSQKTDLYRLNDRLSFAHSNLTINHSINPSHFPLAMRGKISNKSKNDCQPYPGTQMVVTALCPLYY